MARRKTIVFTPAREIIKMSFLTFLICLVAVLFYSRGYFGKIEPVLAEVDYREIIKQELFWQKGDELTAKIWHCLLGYDPTKANEQLAAGLYFGDKSTLKRVNTTVYQEIAQDYYWSDAEAMASWDKMKEKFGQVHLSEEVQVILYHTHNAEDYKPSAGASKSEGKNGGVATAADILADSLERKYGIRTVHNKTLHDYPDWSHSYNNSLKTAKALLNSYPKTKAIFDIHRDAGYTSKSPTTTVINGQNAAKILLVVGANHENYQQNLAFAQALEDKAEEIYPSLFKGIHIAQTARYNQQIHPQALIVEIGSDLNTQEEANYAMECFADICAAVLKEMN